MNRSTGAGSQSRPATMLVAAVAIVVIVAIGFIVWQPWNAPSANPAAVADRPAAVAPGVAASAPANQPVLVTRPANMNGATLSNGSGTPALTQ